MTRACLFLLLTAASGCAALKPQPDYAAISRRLDRARAEITPSLGATTYDLDRQRLLNQPGGENRSLAGSLAYLPGVTVAPSGRVSVRGQ